MRNGNKREVVVITGASAGVGRATAQAFARQGACIGLLARGRAGLEAAKRDVEELGGQASHSARGCRRCRGASRTVCWRQVDNGLRAHRYLGKQRDCALSFRR